MGKAIPDEDEPLELPPQLDGDDGSAGTADAEELALAEIGEGPEDIGLDADTAVDAFDAAVAAEEDDDELSALAGDEAPLEVEPELDVGGEEQGWTEGSEGSAEVWDDDLLADEDNESCDDGGLEGVDDPLLDGLTDEELPSRSLEDEDDDDVTEDLGDDLAREIASEA